MEALGGATFLSGKGKAGITEANGIFEVDEEVTANGFRQIAAYGKPEILLEKTAGVALRVTLRTNR